jgi:SAM-dependent methyltransferase
MLTADFDRLGVVDGDRFLDLGCGFGRHAFAAARRGAWVVALDAGMDEVTGVRSVFGAMVEAGELSPDHARVGVLQANALALPFANGSFDRIVASEVLEHIPDDRGAIAELVRVLRPGGTMAVTVPRCGPEIVNWLLSDAYHDVPGGHIRIYRRAELTRRVAAAGLRPTGGHHTHGLHSPYWWLRCLVGPTNETNRAVAAYHRFLVWDIEEAPWLTRLLERLLSPLIGKSLVLYFQKPAAPRVVPASEGARPIQRHEVSAA